ncbi:hypothetical protein Tco_1419386 [Tanacetum coccineum]
MLQELKTLFAQQAEQELLQTNAIYSFCKHEEFPATHPSQSPDSSYVLKMKSYIDNLERLGHPVTLGLATVNELHAMLKLHEQTLTLPKNNAPALMQFEQVKFRRTLEEELSLVFSRVAEEEKERSLWSWWFRISITQEASGSREDLKIIQEQDTHPSIDTSSNHEEDDLEIDEPQSDIISLFVNPNNYKAALLDPESDKWLNAMNVEMQSMKDNEVWDLVKLPPNGKTVGSKWLFKKKTDMDGALKVSCYTDAGYLTDADDLKSQTGYVFVLNGGVVDWKSAKQSIFATSSTEAEYIAAYDASKEAVLG